MYLTGGSYLLFYERGVKKIPLGSPIFYQKVLTEIPWCFVDSESARVAPPVQVADTNQFGVHLIYVSSPASAR